MTHFGGDTTPDLSSCLKATYRSSSLTEKGSFHSLWGLGPKSLFKGNPGSFNKANPYSKFIHILKDAFHL